MDDLTQKFNNMSIVKPNETRRTEPRDDRLLSKLSPVSNDPGPVHDNLIRKVTANTCLWIRETEEYKTWLHNPGTFLWLQGKSIHPTIRP